MRYIIEQSPIYSEIDGGGITSTLEPQRFVVDLTCAESYTIDLLSGGATGMSAYQQWLAEGNVGTWDDFYESLRGPIGEITPTFQALHDDTIIAKNIAVNSAISADADAIATAADRVQTGLDATATAADRVQTGLDRVQTAADRTQTGLDAAATAADRTQTGLDAAATAADRVQTGLDLVATDADTVATAADRVQTGLDRVAVAADLVLTDADTIATAADRVQTGLDAAATAADLILTDADTVATAADRVQTGLDRVATDADLVQTDLDTIATAADRVQTGLDRVATAADLVQTDLDTIATAADRVQTGLDAIATDADRTQTGLDRIATGADRTQTGIDATNAGTARDKAEQWAENPTDVAVEIGQYSAKHWAAKAADIAASSDLGTHETTYDHPGYSAHVASTLNPHGVTAAQAGAEPAFTKNTAFNKNFGALVGTVTQGDDARLSDARTPLVHGSDKHSEAYEPANANIQSHLNATVETKHTKAQVGLANVDNTSDATKDAAIATLTNKTLTSPAINTPTGIVKADVGLANVDNTSDANKPVSTAQQTALDLKVPQTSTTGAANIPTGTTAQRPIAAEGMFRLNTTEGFFEGYANGEWGTISGGGGGGEAWNQGVPDTIAALESVVIPAGRTVVHPNLTVEGTLTVDGTLFVPSGGYLTQDEVDVTDVKGDNYFKNDLAMYACRAWVNFKGTGTVAIRASGNVSSITDRGVGMYTVNFTNPMPHSDYASSYNSRATSSSRGGSLSADDGTTILRTVNALNVRCSVLSSAGSDAEPVDSDTITVVIHA